MQTNKISFLVAEDEPIILNNMIKKISGIDPCFQVTGKAQNGAEALLLLADSPADVLVTDIEMPGINGLELIRQVRGLYPQMHIIILSGYSNFEYARTAIKYGVEDYLLKPISIDELTGILNPLKECILSEREHTTRNIFHQTLHGLSHSPEVPSKFADERFLLVLIGLGNIPAYPDILSARGQDLAFLWDTIDFRAHLDSQTSFDCFWLIDESCPLQKFIILHSSREEVSSDLTSMRLFHFLKPYLDSMPFHILTDTEMIPYTEIGKRAAAMRLGLSLAASPFSQNYSLYPGPALPAAIDSKERRTHLDYLAKQLIPSAFIQCAQKLFQVWDTGAWLASSLEHLLRDIFGLIPVVFQTPEEPAREALQDLLVNLPALENLPSFLEELEGSLTHLLQDAGELSSDRLFEKLRQYLENSYSQKISINDLADQYGYTPSYLNRIFKKECGQSPLQYLTALRITQAKNLLEQDRNADIRSIASAIGYEDARYFSRVFKNETGMTPSEYQVSFFR